MEPEPSVDPRPSQDAIESPREAEVLDAANAGDTAPFSAFLEEVTPRLRRVARARLDPRVASRLDGDDVLQETFVEVTRALPRYLESRNEGDPKRLPLFLWIRAKLQDAIITSHRRHVEAEGRSVDHEHAWQAETGVTSMHLARLMLSRHTSPTGAVARIERVEQVAAALEELDETDRELLVMRHFEQLSNKDIAKLLGVTESGSSVRHVRALQKLRAVVRSTDLDLSGFDQ